MLIKILVFKSGGVDWRTFSTLGSQRPPRFSSLLGKNISPIYQKTPNLVQPNFVTSLNDRPMPSQDWFCAQHNISLNYLYDYDPKTHSLVWTANVHESVWSLDASKVQQVIDQNSINASVLKQGGNHPPRPSLP